MIIMRTKIQSIKPKNKDKDRERSEKSEMSSNKNS
jgi:hypothetical protein